MQKTNHTIEIYYKCHSGTDNNNKLSVVYTDDECVQRIITIRKVHTDNAYDPHNHTWYVVIVKHFE